MKIIFKSSNFTVPSNPSDGTNPSLGDATGSGARATVFYKTGSTATQLEPHETLPWLSGVTVTLGGSLNTGSLSTACGGFAPSSAVASNDCDFNLSGNANTFNCKGPQSYYRVSEHDCANAQASAGTGAPNDPVAIKIFLNRDPSKLGPTENLMIVLEYQASGLKLTPKSAQSCISVHEPQLTNPDCVDQSYSLFTRALNGTTPKKLQTLIPPQGGRVNATDQTFGGPIQTRQIIVPLASMDSDQTVLQISRTFGLPLSPNNPEFAAYCAPDSPLCVGLVLYSISIFRI